MISLIAKLIFLVVVFALGVYFMQLIKSFGYMNTNELRRRAKTGDLQAAKVLVARSHGLRLWFILWMALIGMVVIMIFLLQEFINNVFISLFVSIVLTVGLLFALPWAKWPTPNIKLAAASSTVLNSILRFLDIAFIIFKPFKLNQKINTDVPVYIHSREDLLDIVEELKNKTTNEKTSTDLSLAVTALNFSTETIRTIMKDIHDVKTIDLDFILTPVAIDELYDAKQSYFPVQHPKTKQFVGILYFQDIKSLASDQLPVSQIMRSDPYYIYVDCLIKQVFYAFLKTQHHLFFVVNDQKEIVGLIDIYDVIKLYLGDDEDDDSQFQQYDDLDEVSQMFGRLESK